MLDMKQIIQKSINLSVLYVEDNKDAMESTMMVFENFFKDIDVAVDGEEGLKKFSKKKYDLIITDINMPNIDGTQMIRDIKELNSDIPIFVFSAHTKARYFESVHDVKVDYYLSKPLSLEELLESLNKVI